MFNMHSNPCKLACASSIGIGKLCKLPYCAMPALLVKPPTMLTIVLDHVVCTHVQFGNSVMTEAADNAVNTDSTEDIDTV